MSSFLPTSRTATHQVDHPGPFPPGVGTQSLEALSLCLDTGAWQAMPSLLPGVQQEAFLVGDTVPLPLALPPAESPDLHSDKAVRTEQDYKHGPCVGDRKGHISSASPPADPELRASLMKTIGKRRGGDT